MLGKQNQDCRNHMHNKSGFPRDDCARKVNNTPGVMLCRNVAFANTPSFCPRVITPHEPPVQSKTSTGSTVNLKKQF